MVTFAVTTEHFFQNKPRARGPLRTLSNSAPTSTKPNPRSNFRNSTSPPNALLGSCSRDPIGYASGAWSLYSFLENRSLASVDPSGQVTISCSCYRLGNSHGGPTSTPSHQPFTIEVDCQGFGDQCCASACSDQGGFFSGNWKLVGQEPDENGAWEEVACIGIDTAENVISFTFIVCDIITVPSGEGAIGCMATRRLCHEVKRCFKKSLKKSKSKRCDSICLAKLIECLDTPLQDEDYGNRCGHCFDKCKANCRANPKDVWPWRPVMSGTNCAY
jgi:hypothetical protein